MPADRQTEIGQLIPTLLNATVWSVHICIDRMYVRSDGFKFLIFQSPVTALAGFLRKPLSADRVLVCFICTSTSTRSTPDQSCGALTR